MRLFKKIKRLPSSDALDAILKSKRHLQQIFDSIQDPIVVLDNQLNIKRLNLSMKRKLSATSYPEAIGKSCAGRIQGREGCGGTCPAALALKSGNPVTQPWVINAEKNPCQYYELSAFPLRDEQGRIAGVIEYYKDVSKQMELEAELQTSEQGRLFGTLAANLVHEIRNALGAIHSVAQYTRDELEEKPALKEEMDVIIKSSETTNTLVSSLMSLARPCPASSVTCCLSDVLEEGLCLVKSNLKKKNISSSLDVPKNITLKLDRTRFIQSLLNFLLNAIEATPAGGQVSVVVVSDDQSKGVRIKIHDTGPGIPPRELKKVFKPFYSTKKEGVGLGLPIAASIIRAHGGSVSLYGGNQGGTTVDIFLPC